MKEEETRPATQPPPASSESQPPPPQRGSGGYYPPPTEGRPPAPAAEGEERNGYPPHEGGRGGPYPADSRGPPPPGPYAGDPRAPYAPPSAWHHPPSHYPPPHHYGDPHAPHYYHPGPPADMSHPPQPRHPDPYRLPPPYPYPYGPPSHYAQPPAPAPRQRTAIACKYCRKRKIRCSGYESSRDGRCNNCVRFNQSCLFHPVSSQAAFVPAQAVYPNMPTQRDDPPPPNARGDYRGQPMYHREGESPPVLYGAHGIPLAPAAGPEHHPGYPPPGAYPSYGPPHGHGPPGPYDYRGQPPPHPPAEEKSSRKRGPPDDDGPSGSPNSSHSPHPSSRARRSHEPRNSNSNGYDYPDPTNIAPTSPSTSSTSYHSGYPYAGATAGERNKAPRRHSPQSAHSFDSPRTLPIRDEAKTTPPGNSESAPDSANGRPAGMSVQAILGGEPRKADSDNGKTRPKDDREMLSKLDGKKQAAAAAST